MNKIIIVGGGKGGVGKTTVTMALVDSLVESGHDVLMIEGDDSNPDAWKALNKLVKCEVCNFDKESGYITLGGLIEIYPESVVVVNTSAKSTKSLIDHDGIINDVCQAMKRDVSILWPINRQRDCIELLTDLVEGSTLANNAKVYALINTYFGSADKFSRFMASKIKEKLAGTLIFPELNDLIADKIIDNRLALSNASDQMSIAEKSVLGRYRAATNKALAVCYV